MRRAAKVDRNHGDIVRALRAVGATVVTLAAVGQGCPDLLVGIGGHTFLLEVKDGAAPPSARKLTEHQVLWHGRWRGVPVTVVSSVGEALEAIQVRRTA